MTDYTEREVREHQIALKSAFQAYRLDRSEACRINDAMLTQLADMLAEREKAKPVAWLEVPPGDQADTYYPGYRFHGRKQFPAGMYDLFTHPAAQVPDVDAELLARRFHDAYERLAPEFGYETREETREFDPMSPNGKLMIAVCKAMLAAQEPGR